jgi:hypothetical protein
MDLPQIPNPAMPSSYLFPKFSPLVKKISLSYIPRGRMYRAVKSLLLGNRIPSLVNTAVQESGCFWVSGPEIRKVAKL